MCDSCCATCKVAEDFVVEKTTDGISVLGSSSIADVENDETAS